MIIVPGEQGSTTWINARLGIPTASQYSRIITQKTLKVSESSRSYLCELAAEWLLGQPVTDEVSQFMDRGEDLEKNAIAFYELKTDVEVVPAGFIKHDRGHTGCSPDALVGDDGGLEIKCPSAAIHMDYLLGAAGDKYKAQIQGGLYVTDREWWDFLSYHPVLPPALVRFSRDETFIAALDKALTEFCGRLDAAKQELTKMGFEPKGDVAAQVGQELPAWVWG